MNDNRERSGIERELRMSRMIDARPGRVFRAWTDPREVAEWWGPHGFTNPVCELDVRPGGRIRIDMTSPEGTVYPMKGFFHEITPHERLVVTTSAIEDEEGNPGLEVVNIITFDDLEGMTRLTLKAAVVKSLPEAEGALEGMEEGWSQSLSRLARHLANAGSRGVKSAV
ncbi:MAG TPA: SRPBCC domain-containing protein [Thermodesulfobacteriota bacterium]|nr:SRPBCC domain-containing protein [Thermodesulfobacteriota bacterium]